MSKNHQYSSAYSFYPESFADLSSVYYDLQEYDLLGRVREYGAEQFVDDTIQPDIDFEDFATFHTKQEILARPQLLIVRKALQELKIMDSINYADCYTVLRSVQINALDRNAYGQSFQFAHRPFDASETSAAPWSSFL